MERQIKERICDNCNKSVQWTEKGMICSTVPFIYSNPFTGWIKVEQEPVITLNIHDPSPDFMDFCCIECAIEFLTNRERERERDEKK